MTGSQHFFPGDIPFQLVYDRGQYMSPITLIPYLYEQASCQ